jgi:hypothetical protein
MIFKFKDGGSALEKIGDERKLKMSKEERII